MAVGSLRDSSTPRRLQRTVLMLTIAIQLCFDDFGNVVLAQTSQTTKQQAAQTSAAPNPTLSDIIAGLTPTTSDKATTPTTTTTTSTTSRPSNAGDVCEAPQNCSAEFIEYTPFDGFYNNYAHPEWGAAETSLLRILPPAYRDGTYEPSGANRPNPLEIAQVVFDGHTGLGSYRNRTAFLVFFGQQMVEEILDAQGSGCPVEYFNIPIPKGHKLFDKDGIGGLEMPFLRTRYDTRTGNSPSVPREQLNEVSAFFDGSLMYGPNKAWSDVLRKFKDGLLKAYNDTDPTAIYTPPLNDFRLPYANPPPPRDHYLKPVKRFYTIGNPRGNENPFLLTMGVLWFRYHNLKARQIKVHHPDWSDEKLFNEARKWTIAVHQKIVYFDWLKAWLSETLPPYNISDPNNRYDPNINPGIAHVFQSAAMRFGHTLVPPGVYRRNANCTFRNTTLRTGFPGKPGLRTCNTFWNPQEAIQESDIDEIIMGMTSQIAEREDNIVTPDLHGDVFGPLDFSRRDLMAVNIQRGRDHGLPDYNTAREFFGLPRITRFVDVNLNLSIEKPEIFQKLNETYGGSMDDLDIWPLGMLETTERGPGPLFRAIIKNQFTRIRNGDRFWFENYRMNKLFTYEEVQEIYNTTIRDVILGVTNIPPWTLQQNPFFHLAGDPCEQPKQLNQSDMEDCTRIRSYDYFHGSEVSFALTILFVLCSVFPFIGLLLCLANRHEKVVETEVSRMHQSQRKSAINPDEVQSVSAVEWMGHKEGERVVAVRLDRAKRQIMVKEGKKLVRTIDLTRLKPDEGVTVFLSADVNMGTMLIRIPKEYDLVLTFEVQSERQLCLDMLRDFCKHCNISLPSPNSLSESNLKTQAVTKAIRQQTLEKFFTAVFAHALNYETAQSRSSRASVSHQEASDVVNCELTKYEFAEALSLKPSSMFVENMFKMMDKDGSGFVSFREFLDIFVTFSKGSADQKAKLMFDMYDLNQSGTLSKGEFKMMLRSMVELANEEMEIKLIDGLVNSVFEKADLEKRQEIDFQDFKRLLADYGKELNYVSLNMQFGDFKVNASKGKRAKVEASARRTIYPSYSDDDSDKRARMSAMFDDLPTIEKMAPKNNWQKFLSAFCYFMEVHRLEIFWAVLYTLVVFGIFIERAYYYSVEREQSGLRRVCGYGVTVTRGAASVQMFCYSTLLITMCRNAITFLRDTFLNRFIPFDSAVLMHKFIALWGGLFTLVHIIGHCLNLYHISTQPANDLACLFRNYFHPTDELPKFQKWAWTTLTGLTGLGLTIHFFLIFVFSTQYARRHLYRGFWIIHNSYPLFFVLLIFHGAGRMIQAPFFYYFFLGPLIVFIIDQLVSVSRKKIEVSVVQAELLPSDVMLMKFKRPNNFEYKSGQWVRIACLEQNSNEYHPFTLTSAPHEELLTLHIRAVGPWTIQLRKKYDPRLLKENKLPKIYIDGPYGEAHEDWMKYEVVIMIGAGIGVTPFASILKDLAQQIASGVPLKCQKVYFIWVTRTQRHFEWLTDIIHEVEKKDTKGIISAHVFITQFKEKFDIRTTMLYICERYFQKISNRSLFTGLRSITHFGRPDFLRFFQVVKKEHPNTNVFGVFTCGPPPLTRSVEKACAFDNKYTSDVLFVHNPSNF